jgi:non-ribosomal peptide synthetase component F
MTTLQQDQQPPAGPDGAAPDGPAAALAYWRRKLDGPRPVLDLPAGQPAAAGPGAAASPVTVPVRAGDGAVSALRQIARTGDTSLYVVLLAAWKVLLAGLTGQRDILAGVSPEDHDPGHPSVLLRTGLDGRPDFRQAVDRVRATVDEAARHSLNLEEIIAGLSWPDPDDDVPLVQVSFDLVPSADDRYRSRPGEPGRAELSLTLREGPGELTGTLSCSAARFGQADAERLAAMFEHVTGRLAAAPDRPVFGWSLVPPTEQDRILHGLNPYRCPPIGYTTMTQPFEEQVRRTPEAVALVSERGDLTYTELNARANRLARQLRAAGAGPGAFVAVSMERSLDLMVALYAVAKSGAAYVPIDPALPDARMTFMLEDSAPVAVLADDQTRARIPAGPWLVLAVDTDAGRWAGQPADDLEPLSGNHLIHMLYTSGTTGRPKAVAYPVDGALADIFWLHRSYRYGPGDTALFKTSYGFDVSIWEIFWPLYHGARIAI